MPSTIGVGSAATLAGESGDPIRMLDLNALHRPLRGALSSAFERVLDSGDFVLGSEVGAFEHRMAQKLHSPYALGVSSGSDALLIALLALGIGPGDEVITSPFTFFATAGAIARAGACPVFVDIAPDSFLLDLHGVSAALTSRTRAVIPVHLFGQFMDLSALKTLCANHGLALIEDVAQAMAAQERGVFAGTVGDFGCFSLFPAKNLGGLGDGGLVTCRNGEMADKARQLRTHGANARDGANRYAMVGGNFRLHALQAALLQVKLPLLAEHNRARRQHAQRYAQMFSQAQLDPARLQWPHMASDNDPCSGNHVFNQFTLRVPDVDARPGHLTARNRLALHLRKHQIESRVYYPTPLHLQPCFVHLGYVPGQLPCAEQACAEVLSIPVHPTLTDADVHRVAEVVVHWVRQGPAYL